MPPSRQASPDSASGCVAAACRGLLAGMAGLLVMVSTPAQTGGGFTRAHSVRGEAAARGTNFGAAVPAPDARHLADWIARTRDNQGKAFFLIDKVHATLYVFDRNARLQASTPVLLGAAVGDD